MTASLDAAKEAVIKAAIHIVYDGMNEAAWHKIKRAVLAMEALTPAAPSQDTVLPWPCSCGRVDIRACPVCVPVSNKGGVTVHHPALNMPNDRRAHEMWSAHPADITNLGFADREAFYLAHIDAITRRSE